MTITAPAVGDQVGERLPTDPSLATETPTPPKPKATPAIGQAAPKEPIRKLLSKQARPHVAMACLMGAAGAAQIAAETTGEPGVVAIATAIVLFAGAVLIAIIKRTRLAVADLAETFGKGWVTTLVTSIAGWLITVAATGITWDSTAILAIGGATLGLRWWQQHRIPNTTPKPAPAPVTAPAVTQQTLDALAERWAATVSCKGGKLPGATLGAPVKTPVGQEYLVQLVPGRQTFASLVNALPLIATGLRCASSDLVPEAVPGDESLAKLTVLTNSPLKQRVVFTEPVVPGDGLIGLGPWGDGDGYAAWRLYTDNSMWGGALIGGIGSGKSVMMSAIAIAAQLRGDTTVWFIDGQDGASSPEMIDRADWAVGRERAIEMLKAAAAIVEWRSKQNVSHRWSGFTPSPQRPGILIEIDECHLVFEDEECRKVAEYIARVGRKVGVALLCVSQYAGIKTFGGSKPLRSAIMQGNAVALYTANKGEKNFFPNLELDPSKLPAKQPGYGYLIDVTGQGKTAPFRGRDFERRGPDDAHQPTDWAKPHSVAWWWDQCPTTPLDMLAITAADGATDGGYTNRHELAQEELGKWDEAVAAMEAGKWIGGKVPIKALAKPATESATPAKGLAGLKKLVFRPSRRFGETRPSDNRPGSQLGRRITVPTIPAGLTDGETRVYRALQAGPRKPAELKTPANLSLSGVHKALEKLQKAGHVHQPAKFGPYELAVPSEKTEKTAA